MFSFCSLGFLRGFFANQGQKSKVVGVYSVAVLKKSSSQVTVLTGQMDWEGKRKWPSCAVYKGNKRP